MITMWAIFDASHRILPATVRTTESRAWRAMKLSKQALEELRRNKYYCASVQVTPTVKLTPPEQK